jgi:hypothetical protein
VCFVQFNLGVYDLPLMKVVGVFVRFVRRLNWAGQQYSILVSACDMTSY